jgi:hypothetical protein
MSKRRCLWFGPALRKPNRCLANPLWPLEELRDLRNRPFVADPEFTPVDIDALRPHDRSVFASPSKTQFPIPRLVSGLPWRFAENILSPIVPDVEFAPLDLSYIGNAVPAKQRRSMPVR